MIEKFKKLIHQLFQFDSSELDFGIYRILKYKREQVEKFIDQDLPAIIEKEFEKHKKENIERLKEEFDKIKNDLINSLGKNALTPIGEIKPEFKNTPIAKRYLDTKARLEEYNKIQEIESQVYNDLYNFFSRYYKDGDFLPKHRFSIKNYRYAIPYNGEEIKLYWANYDQYYIKTGLLFRDYTFGCLNRTYKVSFRIVSAKEEVNSNKATKSKYFVLTDENSVEFDEGNKYLVIRFEYRELTQEEKKAFGFPDKESQSKIQKELITPKIIENILNSIPDNILKEGLIKEKKQDLGILEYHLNRFIAKNTRDYFIHKDLKKFLSEQLDYFIKAEILNLDDILKSKYFDKHITRAKVVKEVGEKIIDFLASIEEFQKKLWEKKKFVVKTEYVITMDKIKEIAGEEFLESILEEILNNEKQLKEWRELGLGEIKKKETLLAKNDLTGKEYKKLPIDTKYFSQDFKEKLLEKLTEKASLDDLLDGILIKSENWQALNLLSRKFKEKVKCIYIDPPYNTGSDEFLYRDNYQHASWLSMMENRLNLAKVLMKEDSVIFVSIGDEELKNLNKLMDDIFTTENKISLISRVMKTASDKGNFFAPTIDYILNYAKNIKLTQAYKDEVDINLYPKIDKDGRRFRDDVALYQARLETRPHQRYYIECPDGSKVIPPENGVWRWTRETFLKNLKLGKIVFKKTNNSPLLDENGNQAKWNIYTISYYDERQERGTRPRNLITEFINRKGADLIKRMDITYDYSKPVELIHYLLKIIQPLPVDIILDFFAGSGTTAHAVMKLNKEDNGKRKYILVEMADYFDAVILPRIKKVAYSFNWQNGKPQDTDGIGQFIKYHYLEQYEDSLDNIEFRREEQGQKLMELFPDYIKYILDYETEGSPSLLNIDLMEDPFNYKLKVNLKEVGEPKEEIVDLVETFNYLIGLKVDKYKFKELNGEKYVFVFGEKEFRKVVVIWRNIKGFTEEDYKRDREFIREELKDENVEVVYLNGQGFLEKELNGRSIELKNIEAEFKRLMFEKPL